MMISGVRTKQLDIFLYITGFTNGFLSFIVVELIRFFHGALQLPFLEFTFDTCVMSSFIAAYQHQEVVYWSG